MKTIKQLIHYLSVNKLTIASCESFTGGLIANEITNIPGASQVFVGGFICYSNTFKTKQVKVSKRVIKKYGAISEQCAIEMACKTLKQTKADIAISFTGNAGPTTIENKPVGVGFICIASKYKKQVILIQAFDLARVAFKQHAIVKLLEGFNIFIK